MLKKALYFFLRACSRKMHNGWALYLYGTGHLILDTDNKSGKSLIILRVRKKIHNTFFLKKKYNNTNYITFFKS